MEEARAAPWDVGRSHMVTFPPSLTNLRLSLKNIFIISNFLPFHSSSPQPRGPSSHKTNNTFQHCKCFLCNRNTYNKYKYINTGQLSISHHIQSEKLTQSSQSSSVVFWGCCSIVLHLVQGLIVLVHVAYEVIHMTKQVV